MINCIVLKWLGNFNIAKNPSIISKSFCSGTDAGLGENESMTRIKEHPSYIIFLTQASHFIINNINGKETEIYNGM